MASSGMTKRSDRIIAYHKGSGRGREPKQTTCVRMAGVEGVTRGERATGIPWEPSYLYLFVPMKVNEWA